MRRSWYVMPLLLVLAVPALAGRTVPVTIRELVGLPADPSDRDQFLDAFHAAMEADLPAEQRMGDGWSTSAARTNPYRLVDAAPADVAWTVDLSIGFPPPVRITRPRSKDAKVDPRPRIAGVRASRGLLVAVAVASPEMLARGADATPCRFELYFPDARRIVVPSRKLPGGGYDYPWADAGSVVARATLEALQRASGAMSENERADLAPAARVTGEAAP